MSNNFLRESFSRKMSIRASASGAFSRLIFRLYQSFTRKKSGSLKLQNNEGTSDMVPLQKYIKLRPIIELGCTQTNMTDSYVDGNN